MIETQTQLDRFIDEEERRQLTTLSRTTWWRLERRGAVPKRRHIAPNRSAWLLSEIQAWMKSHEAASEPVPWITKALKTRARRAGDRPDDGRL